MTTPQTGVVQPPIQIPLPFEQVGRIPLPGDNAAIASCRLTAGTSLILGDRRFMLSHTILEGHRFAIVPIGRGQPLLSWGLPFGIATQDIAPGDYVCNARILEALAQRHVDFPLPETPNFRDHLKRYALNEHEFKPGRQVARAPSDRFFQGFFRSTRRGVGTRNFIVILGTSSRTASYARALADRFKQIASAYRNIDGVVALAHTEGGGSTRPNNFDLLLRTLAGLLVHPNVGAVLAVDLGTEPVTNAMVRQYCADHDYPLGEVLHRFESLRGNFASSLNEGEEMVRPWLEMVNQFQRTPQPLEHLRIALQCGGSDAFSGVSGNPLAGLVAKEIVRYGGSANLAETDELIGAEPYVLQNVRDLETARKFLRCLEQFQERAAWHGHDAEGNPSGGNNFRGLYNIAIKSIGAARKKDPEVCLDEVIAYGERMGVPGFYFMDSPGNDLEGIAGQVASGCNLILFTTGNGSITNFPFVPTIKIMTNTGRYRMLTNEMDVNAGRYQDGTPLDVLGGETFELTLRVASGERSAGEKTGQSQVQFWREWRQTNASRLSAIWTAPRPTGQPLALVPSVRPESAAPNSGAFVSSQGSSREARSKSAQTSLVKERQRETGSRRRSVGLIVPTSLCSSQVARVIAEKLNQDAVKTGWRFVALAHTEGCGVSGGESELLYLRTMAGYLAHPLVHKGLLLEHGCEKTHNDAMRNFLDAQRIDRTRFGWASIQLDGGLESVTAKIMNWFQTEVSQDSPADTGEVKPGAIRVGLTADGDMPESIATSLAEFTRCIVDAGGTVVIPQNSPLLVPDQFVSELLGTFAIRPSLAYGQPFTLPGLHVMEAPTDHPVETLTGLGATGVEVLLAHIMDRCWQAHPMVPLVQIGSRTDGRVASPNSDDLDLMIDLDSRPPDAIAEDLLRITSDVLLGAYTPKQLAAGNTDFQMTRGLLGISL